MNPFILSHTVFWHLHVYKQVLTCRFRYRHTMKQSLHSLYVDHNIPLLHNLLLHEGIASRSDETLRPRATDLATVFGTWVRENGLLCSSSGITVSVLQDETYSHSTKWTFISGRDHISPCHGEYFSALLANVPPHTKNSSLCALHVYREGNELRREYSFELFLLLKM